MKHLIYIFTFALSLTACNQEKQTAVQETLRPVRYKELALSGGKATHTFSGAAQSSEETSLSFKVAGTIRSILVKLGDRVQKGQLIATIDPSDFNIQVEQAAAQQKGAEAQVKSAETKLLTARSIYLRVEKLYENNSVPLSEYEQAKSNYEAAQASYDAALTQVTTSAKQVQSARNQVDYTRLAAPFSGVITAVNIEANELVGSGTPVAVISSETQPEVNVGVPEMFIAQVKKGQTVRINFSVLPGKPFTGVIEEVAYAAGASPTYPVIVRIQNPSAAIRPGMAATVTFNLDGNLEQGPQRLVAPVKAVGEDTEGHFVFVLQGPDGQSYTARKRRVEIGELLPNGFEVREGLQEGELVATAGLKSLLDNMKVKLLED